MSTTGDSGMTTLGPLPTGSRILQTSARERDGRVVSGGGMGFFVPVWVLLLVVVPVPDAP